MAVATAPDLIGTRDACTILGIDRATLTRWVKDGRLVPATKLPGRTGAYLFHRADIVNLTRS